MPISFPFHRWKLANNKNVENYILVSCSTVQKRQAHLSSTSLPRFACLRDLIRYLVNFTFKILFFQGAFREMFSLSIIFHIAELEIGDLISNTVVWTLSYNPAHLPTSSNIGTKRLRSVLNRIIFFWQIILYIIIPFPLCSSGVLLACENRTGGDVLRRGTSATQRQKIHTDDVN